MTIDFGNPLGAAILVLLGVLVEWLIAYMRRKGENLATREDIRALTEIPEQMRRENAELLEHFRFTLQRDLAEHGVVFARLHERRADPIADLYSRLVHAQKAAAEYLRYFRERDDEELWRRFTEEVDAARALFDAKRIFLSISLSGHITRALHSTGASLNGRHGARSAGFSSGPHPAGARSHHSARRERRPVSSSRPRHFRSSVNWKSSSAAYSVPLRQRIALRPRWCVLCPPI